MYINRGFVICATKIGLKQGPTVGSILLSTDPKADSDSIVYTDPNQSRNPNANTNLNADSDSIADSDPIADSVPKADPDSIVDISPNANTDTISDSDPKPDFDAKQSRIQMPLPT